MIGVESSSVTTTGLVAVPVGVKPASGAASFLGGAGPRYEGRSWWVLMTGLSSKLKEGLQVPNSSLLRCTFSVCGMPLR